MPRKFAVIEIDRATSHHLQIHTLWLPLPPEKDFYRQVTSFNAFFHSGRLQGRANGPNWSPEKLFSERDWDEYERDCERWIKCLAKDGILSDLDDRKLPQLEHQSIWDFYQAIGYEYKKQRWIR